MHKLSFQATLLGFEAMREKLLFSLGTFLLLILWLFPFPATASSPPSEVNLRVMMVPPGRYGRHIEFPLHARYITIHSTDNPNATAYQHAVGMAHGRFRAKSRWNRTGYLTWHFTVDDQEAIQSLPLTIQGEHADHDGPGNRTSIGIEICEFRNPVRQAKAIDRAAKLTAWLMREEDIPLDHVVPHWYWPQWHFHGYRKNCPRILLEHGRPGRRWEAFLQRIAAYYRRYYGTDDRIASRSQLLPEH
ncbi:peptidoglycan recognition protein family protein [Candidatus Methylacidithermus pantelleriae]|uniref:N-acetylmuramoyl-L-alanine amidase n=1 Tax=Candidatus Methylacidithermus pantelleriae TaxID=2744239 RepID=A0A8J2BTH3_9BACT|nr:N-acetylmuramoyl-L-alanine amidase [Candidatus Methylacidithermus pantelleriae]CAF0697847.1 putative N-acetylmuramoyl-L-alanine amidase [Candidatus Methylacidithermus pantelleriae]